ncbi:selp [Pungitius sinensis]
MTWTMARQWCRSNYTDMVVIQSQEENNYLVSQLPMRTSSPYYWIGITKKKKNDPWTWIGNNSTWIDEKLWAQGEPNNKLIGEFCVEIYVREGKDKGKWNDEKCAKEKFPVCYEAQCNPTSCERGRCQETPNNTTCHCDPGFEGDRCQTAQCNATSCERGRCQETPNNTTCHCDPGFKGDRCQTAVKCPPLPDPENGNLSCSGENLTFNSTCRLKCYPGFLIKGPRDVTCCASGVWSGPRPHCAIYKQGLFAVVGCASFSVFFCICFCWMQRRKRNKPSQEREPEEGAGPSDEAHG